MEDQTPHNQDTSAPQGDPAPAEQNTAPDALLQPQDVKFEIEGPDGSISQTPMPSIRMMSDTRRRHAEYLQQVLPDKRRRAVEFLQAELREAAGEFRAHISEDPEAWWARPHGGDPALGFPGRSFHVTGGMSVRNALRHAGMDEAWFGIANLDDVYVGLIELAIMGEDYYTDVAPLP